MRADGRSVPREGDVAGGIAAHLDILYIARRVLAHIHGGLCFKACAVSVGNDEGVGEIAVGGRRVSNRNRLSRLYVGKCGDGLRATLHNDLRERIERCPADVGQRQRAGNRCAQCAGSGCRYLHVRCCCGGMHGSQFAELQIIDGEEIACFVSACSVQTDAGAAVCCGEEHGSECGGRCLVYLRFGQDVLRHCPRLRTCAEPGGDDVGIAVARGCLEREFVNVLCVEEEGRRNEPVVAVEHRLFGIGVGHVALFVKPSIVVAVGIFDGERHQTARCVERFLIGQGHFLAEHDFLRRGGFALYVAPITFHIVGVNAEARNLCRLGAGGGVALVDGCAVGLAHHFIGNGRAVHVTAVRALRRAPCHRDTIVSAERGGGVDSLGRVAPNPYALHVHGAAAGGVAGIYFNNVCAFGHRGRHADATACGCGALGNDVAVNAHAVSECSGKGIAAKGLAGQREAHGAARRALGKVGGNAADAPGSAGGGEGRGGVKTHKLHVLVYCGEFLGCARCEVHFAYLNVLLRAVRRHHPEEAARGIVERGGLVVFDVLARGADERQRGGFLVNAHQFGIFADAVEFALLVAGKGEEFLGKVADGRHFACEHVERAEVITAPRFVVTQSEAAEHLVGHGVVGEV